LGYIDREIFEDWFGDTFVAEVVERRNKYNYQGPAYPIMFHCSAHSGDTFLALCRAQSIITVFIQPHSYRMLQVLDVFLFGVTKLAVSKLNR
jgi:hypothetical protein